MGEAFIVDTPTSAALRALNYTPEVERLRFAPDVAPLGTLVSEIGGSFGAVFTRIDCDAAHGVPLYSQVDTFAAEPEGRTIRRDAMPRPDAQAVRKWQILVAAAGQMGEGNLFGRSILADDRLVRGYCGPDTLALTFADPGNEMNLWVYAFLNSRIGLRAVRSTAYGTSIPRLRPDLMAEIPIPLPKSDVQQRVSKHVRRCVEQREQYLREVQLARQIIDSLPEMQQATAMCEQRKARATMWSGPLPTLNALNYASAGEALPYLIRKWRPRLGDLVPRDRLFRGGRYQRISCQPPFGVDFLNQRDVFSIRPSPRRIVAPAVPRALVHVPEFSLLAGGQGTLGEGELFGRVALVTKDIARAGVTEHLLRLQPVDRTASALLYAFLSTLVGRRLLRSTGVGTKLLSLRPDLVSALPVPDLPSALTAKVLAHLERASAARASAVQADQAAVSIVEEVLPAWLG